jgi:glycerol-3-phosphate dehydrogenase
MVVKYVNDFIEESPNTFGFKKLQLKDSNEIKPLPHKLKFKKMTPEEINELVKKDEKWGRIICRCEKVTEAEIINAIHSPVPATTIDAIKRRVRAGMGRCQGGFCAPRITEILSRELKIDITKVKKGGKNSEIAVGGIKA